MIEANSIIDSVKEMVFSFLNYCLFLLAYPIKLWNSLPIIVKIIILLLLTILGIIIVKSIIDHKAQILGFDD